MKKYNQFLKTLLCLALAVCFLGFNVYADTSLNVCDLNSDGSTNNRDLALLVQYINGWDVQINRSVADFNPDGEINNKDYCLLMRYINGWGDSTDAEDYDGGIELPTDEWQ